MALDRLISTEQGTTQSSLKCAYAPIAVMSDQWHVFGNGQVTRM